MNTKLNKNELVLARQLAATYLAHLRDSGCTATSRKQAMAAMVGAKAAVNDLGLEAYRNELVAHGLAVVYAELED